MASCVPAPPATDARSPRRGAGACARLLAGFLAAAALIAAAGSPASAVTGGRPASQPYPFMAALVSEGEQFCGASLLQAEWLLTAAHCVADERARSVQAILGRTKLSGRGGEQIAVDRIELHERYSNDPGAGYDVALLHLAEPSAQAPIGLAGPQDGSLWEPRDSARVIGWGGPVYLVGPGYDDLQEVDVPIVDDGRCRDSYPEFDQDTMLCAGEANGIRDSCQGDSGGPLFVFDGLQRPLQVGVVSYGTGCGFPGYYGVYARVGDAALRDWVLAKVPGLAPAPSPGGPGGGSPAPEPRAVRLRFARNLGSAGAARRLRRVRLRISATAPVRSVRIVVSARRRVVARGRVARVAGRRVVRVRLARGARLRAGSVRVSMSGRDERGRRVRAAGTGRLRR